MTRPHDLCAFAALLLGLGCQHTPKADRECVSQNVSQRFGATLNDAPCVNQLVLPPGVSLDKPLSEDQAVLTALWNNPAFQELLVELQITRSDLIQANLLPNPEVVFFFQMIDKPFKYAADLPIEAFWLRPIRLKSAKWENSRAIDKLTQAALDLIRDTRQAYADTLLARDRVKVAKDGLELRTNIADLVAKRLKAGDASVQEAATGKIDSLQAKQDLTKIGFEVALAEEKLKNLMGVSGHPQPLVLEELPSKPEPLPDTEALVNEAVRIRPDAQAAEEAVEAAAERLRLAKLGWVRFLGMLDATSGRNTGHEFGPAFRVTLPIFNRNQGGIARAEAEHEQLLRRRLSVHNQIILDVKLAAVRYDQSRAELDVLRTDVRPQVEAAIERAKKAQAEGNVSLLLALELSRMRIDTDNREAQLKADFRRAKADLERSLGRKLTAPTPGPSPPP